MSEAVLSCRALTKTYQGPQAVPVLQGIDLDITPGERIAIMGRSGSGKSTLLHVLGGLDAPSSGTVTVRGRPFSAMDERERGTVRNATLGFVYQFHHLLPEFSALENIVLPQLILGLSRAEAEGRASQLLDSLGISERGDHRPAQLSGGEQQRVAIARAVANGPRLLLADEPTGNLDPPTAERVFDQLLSLVRQSGVAALIATHNLELAARMDRTLRLKEGLLVEEQEQVTVVTVTEA